MNDSKSPDGTPSAYQEEFNLAPELLPYIFRIPNEILSFIFLLNTTSRSGNTDDPRKTTMATSQVCQRWRNVALAYPGLWSRIIDFTKDPAPLVIELLDRSNPVPIDVGRVSQQVVWRRGRKIMKVLHGSTQRIRTFNAEMRGESDLEHVGNAFLLHPAPYLEFLRLNVTRKAPLGGLLFQGHAPALRRLHLINCDIKFISSTPMLSLSGLTELSIAEFADISVSTWVSILIQMSSLHWLSIIDSFAPTHETPSHPHTQAHLPKLSMLTLTGPFNDCVSLIDHIVFSPLCSLRLECVKVLVGHELDQVLDIAEQRTSQWSLHNMIDHHLCVILFESGRIFVGNPHRLGTTASWDTCEAASLKSGCHIDGRGILTLDFTWERYSDDDSSCSQRLLSSFRPISSVVESLFLWIDDDMLSSPETFLEIRKILLSFHRLEALHVMEESSMFILDLLVNPELREESSDILLPLLKTIFFIDPRFADDDERFDTLLSFIQQRMDIQAPIKNIKIASSDDELPLQMNQRQQDVLDIYGVHTEISESMYEEFQPMGYNSEEFER